jgi:S1-C subfamily serine protease
MTVLPGSPREGVRLQVGDLITKIDGKALDGTLVNGDLLAESEILQDNAPIVFRTARPGEIKK